jgi:5-methylcytosine-specific restriction enzyme A
MTGTSFVHAKRGSMTPQRALRIFQRDKERCQGPCERPLKLADDWHVDHVIALENGGSDDDDNLQVLCDWCHGQKTGDDHEQAGKGRRAAVKHVVPSRFKRSRWRR